MSQHLSAAQRDVVEAYRQGLGPRAATRLSDERICRDAMTAAARVDVEVERMQRAGELKSLNKSYRTYRLEASARGECVLRYADWMHRYKTNLVREIATKLR